MAAGNVLGRDKQAAIHDTMTRDIDDPVRQRTAPTNATNSRHSTRLGRRTLLKGIGAGLSTAIFGGALSEDTSIVETASADGQPYRPDYHFSPDDGWMNDPNGMVYQDGAYHLFYQAGEDRRRWDHATSTDLVNWTEHGTKIPDTSTIQAFSGGAVIDANDTSGFGTDALVCMYTGRHDDGTQDQRLAYSTDGGDTVTKYAGNPVIDTHHDDWRDPNPFWYEPAGEWRMTIARVSSTTYDGTTYPAGIEIWRSPDLKHWTYLSTYESGGAGWECPDLYELPVTNTGERRWVMTVSVEWDHVEHHVGHFDGTTFTVENTVYANDGRDFYGGQSWDNEPATDTRLSLSWMNHWDYATNTPDNGWKGAQSFPQRLELYDTGSAIEPRQRPDGALESTRENRLASLSDEPISSTADPLSGTNVQGQRLEILATIDPGDADSVTLGVREGDSETTRITYDAVNTELVFDRNDSGVFFGNTNKDVASGPMDPLSDGTIQLRVLVDRSLVEIFGNDGRFNMSNQIFPHEDSIGTSLTASGGTATLESLTAYGFEPGLVDGATYRIENYNSAKTLEVRDAGTGDGNRVQQWDWLGYDHQKWAAHEVASGVWRFENVNSGRVLDVEDASTEQGAYTMQWEWWGGDNQKWAVEEMSNGLYRLQNVNSGWYLDVEDASTADGANGMQWEWWGSDNQYWRFERLD